MPTTFRPSTEAKNREYVDNVEQARREEADIVERSLPVRLTDGEVLDAARRAAELFRERHMSELAKKAAMLQFKEEAEHLDAQIIEAQTVIRDGMEHRQVYCRKTMHRDLGEVVYTRLDTLEIVETRPMTAKERQTEMEL